MSQKKKVKKCDEEMVYLKLKPILKKIPIEKLERLTADNPEPALDKDEASVLAYLAFKIEEIKTGKKSMKENTMLDSP